MVRVLQPMMLDITNCKYESLSENYWSRFVKKVIKIFISLQLLLTWTSFLFQCEGGYNCNKSD